MAAKSGDGSVTRRASLAALSSGQAAIPRAGADAAASLRESPRPQSSDAQIPPEAKGLQWPASFCEAPKGERLEIVEEGTLVRRTSGVGFSSALVGPLSLEKGTAYFEVEVAELEPKRSQTMAIGVCCALPPEGRAARSEKARDLGQGSFLLGYDLPKVFAHGKEVAKIGTREWRPLKELVAGDRVGLLVERSSMELTVFVNGARRASASLAASSGAAERSSASAGGGSLQPSARWPQEVWGVVDVYGTVRAVRLRGPDSGGVRQQRLRGSPTATSAASTAPAEFSGGNTSAVSPDALVSMQAPRAAPERVVSTSSSSGQAAAAPPPPGCSGGIGSGGGRADEATGEAASAADLHAAAEALAATPLAAAETFASTPLPATPAFPGSARRPASRVCLDVVGGPRKRLRMTCHPCGCMVHLLRETGDVIHVPRMGDFVIGRNPKSCNLTLDSPEVPNMVSRRHAVIISAEDAVMIMDCESVNGTFVNGRRVGRETLRQGDEVIIGNPTQSPRSFRFAVSMPPSS